jgi:ribosomal protein L29
MLPGAHHVDLRFSNETGGLKQVRMKETRIIIARWLTQYYNSGESIYLLVARL